MTPHEMRRSVFIRRIECDGLDFPATTDVVNPSCRFPSAPQVGIRKSYGSNLGLPTHIVCGRRAHHSRSDHEQFQESTSYECFKIPTVTEPVIWRSDAAHTVNEPLAWGLPMCCYPVSIHLRNGHTTGDSWLNS